METNLNILILGNGFDLYHKLPTKYGDFLDFIKLWDSFHSKYQSINQNDNTTAKEQYIDLIDNKITKSNMEHLATFHKLYDNDNITKFNDLIAKNSFIKYFLNSVYKDKGWIDFEAEIEEIILYFKKVISSTNNHNLNCPTNHAMDHFSNYIEQGNFSNGTGHRVIRKYRVSNDNYGKVDTKQLLVDLKSELDSLILCLNIYLLEFIEKININHYSKDISNLKISNIINFNYTNTYTRIYSNEDNPIKIHNLHGKSGSNDNIVLGMKDDKVSDLEYVYFFKYFQRIQKKTGNDYKHWLNNSPYKSINFYVFGHSLDLTDADIFKEIIESDRTNKVTIYYRNQLEYEKFVINLIKILGKDPLINYTSTELIEFKELQP